MRRVPADLRSRAMIVAFAFIVATRIAALPGGPWEFDEPLFFGALHHYSPVDHNPPPPGYPLFILTAQAVKAIAGDDFITLVAVSFIASLIGFVLLALAFRNIAGDLMTGIAGATLFYMSPGLLLHSTLPISDPGALMLLSATIFLGTRAGEPPAPTQRQAVLFAIFAAATVGWRPQFSIIVLPLFFTTLVLMRSWRARVHALIAFTITCILWLIPLAVAVGGIKELFLFETGQAQYLAAQDADESRGNWSAARIAVRFIAHPWGTKWLAAPILLLALIGLWRLARHRTRAFLPIAIAGAVYLAFALAVMDPADGVRYALPFTLVASLLAGAGTRNRRIPIAALVAGFSIGSIAYVGPHLVERRTTISPPMRAVAFAKTFPPNAVVLYDQALWPHSRFFLQRFHPRRVDLGMNEYADRPDVPLFILADGFSNLPGTRTFEWTLFDAYSKLTRNHYRVVSVSPLPPERRFVTGAGVYPPERTPDGEEWRWLTEEAVIRLPHLEGKSVARLRLGLPVSYPFEDNVLRVFVDDRLASTVPLRKATSVTIDVPLPRPGAAVRFEAQRSFVPMELPGTLFRDPRRLAVKLYGIELR
jgi:hypothetical protein